MTTYQNGSDTAYAYAYDDNGNISSIIRGSTAVAYQYNGANELTRENNQFTNQTVVYTYDTWGNLATKKIYAYTTATNPGTPTSTITYGYGNSAWKDQLTSYNGQTIAYEPVYNEQQVLIGYSGNPAMYRGKTLSWYGNQLTKVAQGTSTIASYVYDSNGLRQRKTASGTNTDYCYNGSVLIGLTKGSDKLRFSYDAAGQVQAVDFNGTYYYYLRNGQGDIVKIIDNSGAAKVEYTYDSWGKKLSCTGTLATTLGVLNPFRYRGYVYDEETGFYYLKSRYYDPETCRFISADVLLSTGQGVIGHNCYAYCLNIPVELIDQGGSVPSYNVMIADGGGSGESSPQFIDDQDDPNISYFAFGPKGTIKDNGCGMIALYNVLQHSGERMSFQDFLHRMRPESYYLWGGKLGMDPIYLHDRLVSQFGAKNVITVDTLSSSTNFDSIIFLYFYKVGGTGLFQGYGAHYFAATKSSTGYTVHNGEALYSGEASGIWGSQTDGKNAAFFGLTIWGIYY